MALTDTDLQSTVERLGVEPVVSRPKVVPIDRNQSRAMNAPTPPNNSEQAGRLEVYEAIASVIAASAAVLATRLILLLALIGAFSLAVMAVTEKSWIGLAVLVAYAVLVVIPLVLLETKTRWTGGG